MDPSNLWGQSKCFCRLFLVWFSSTVARGLKPVRLKCVYLNFNRWTILPKYISFSSQREDYCRATNQMYQKWFEYVKNPNIKYILSFSFHDLPLTLVWSYCSTFVLRANSWIWPLLAFLSFEPHSYLIITLTVRVTVKESWNQLEKIFVRNCKYWGVTLAH